MTTKYLDPLSDSRCGESVVFCPGNDIWAFSVLWHRALLPGQSRWLLGPLCPGHSRLPALPRTRGLNISLSLTWDRPSHSELCTGPAPGRERGRLERSRAAPRRLESWVTSFQFSSQSLPALRAAGAYCVKKQILFMWSCFRICFRVNKVIRSFFNELILVDEWWVKRIKKKCFFYQPVVMWLESSSLGAQV